MSNGYTVKRYRGNIYTSDVMPSNYNPAISSLMIWLSNSHSIGRLLKDEKGFYHPGARDQSERFKTMDPLVDDIVTAQGLAPHYDIVKGEEEYLVAVFN